MTVHFKPLTPSVLSLLVWLSVGGTVMAQSSGPAQVQSATGPATVQAPAPAGQKLDLLGDRKVAPVSRATNDKADKRATPPPLVPLPSLGLCDGS